MKNKKLYITLFIISIIFLGIGGTFAYLTVSVNATNITQVKAGNLTMTIDGGGNENVTLFPAKCTSAYAIKKTIKASAKNTSGGKVSFSVGMNVAVLSDSLKRTTMKYALSTSATSCTDGLIANGNFKDATQGSDIWIVKNDYDNITQSSNTYTKTYYLYIWLDESETENISSGNISVNMKGTSSNNPNLTTKAVKYIPLYETIKNAADITTQIDFSQTSAASSTNGIYMTTDTEGNVPVYYYRGNVDNRIIFANFCWRIVRTTETGGVKLIYDGKPSNIYGSYESISQDKYSVTNDENYPFVYDNSNKTWKSNILNAVEEGTDGITSVINFSGFDIGSYQIEINMKGNTTDNYSAVLVNGDTKWIFGKTDTNVISLDLASSDTVTIGYLKGTASTDGSDYVEFSIKKGVGSVEKKYCDMTKGATIGESAFNSSGDDNAYVGYMYGTSGSSTYASTHANTNDSTIKGVIDTWYHDNMTSYTSQLEDAVWCNDRSIVTDLANSNGGTYSSYTILGYGTNPTLYGPASRVGVSNPTLKCAQDNDKFTVNASNGNGALTYPVGLITADEIVYAGGVLGTINSSFYLYTGQSSWTLSPFYFSGSKAGEFNWSSNWSLTVNYVGDSRGVRPSVSLQPGIAMTGGSGTSADPFVIG